MLLMVKAVLEDDEQLILEIKNMLEKELDGTLSHSENSDYTTNSKYAVLYSEEVREHIINGRIRTSVPIKLALKYNSSSILEKLLSVTNIVFDTGSVGWDDLNLTELDISWITNLPRRLVIKQLNLSKNHFSILPFSMGSHLRRCTKLDLHQNNIKYIPTSILELPLINELNLSHNQISELPYVLWSASLTRLDLSYNELNTLPNCATELCADSMKVLKLQHNQLENIPKCVCFLCNLNTLDISYNSEISVLPADLGRLKELNQLILDGLPHLYDPPPSICENSATCISYLRSRFLKQNKFYRMKLMLVGKQAVGKTTLVARLEGKQYLEGSTVGVDISRWSYRPSLFKPIFSFSVWDFAGQEEYYATHQVFLCKRSLYIVVWNILEGNDGIGELKSWLNNIVSRAPESCIIIVATHLDVLIAEIGSEQALVKRDEYRMYLTQTIGSNFIERNVVKIMFVGLKGKHDNALELKKEIYNIAENYEIDGHPIMGFSIPSSYEKVDRKVYDLSVPVLHAIEFKKVVRNLGQLDLQSDDEIRAVTLFLHDSGSLLHFDDHRRNLDDLYFVKPQWLSKLISNVIIAATRRSYVKDGRITKSDFKGLLEQAGKEYSEEFLEQCLVLFNRFEIALPLDKEGNHWLIPCFLPSERPAIVDVLNLEYYYQRQFQFCDAVTPPGLWSRLLSRLMNTVTEVRDSLDHNDSQKGELHYWDKGLFYCRSDGLLFVIESSLSSDGISIIYSSKAAQEGLLGQLVNLVQQIVSEWFPGLKFEQKFCCYECAKEKRKGCFKLEELLNYVAENKPLSCQVCLKDLDLKVLAPDLLLDDIHPKCIIDIDTIHCYENEIQSGRFGRICHGDIHSETSVIVKFYDINEESGLESFEAQFRIFRTELAYLQRIRHPCLVGLIGVCKYPNFALVMEDGPMGSLDSCILKELHEVPRLVVYRIAAQIASALRFLHSIPIIYRGLTARQVLIWSLSLDDLVNCKLADLEVAICGDMWCAEGQFVHPIIAPEVSKQAVYDERVDIFSLGIVFLQLMQRSYPTERSLIEWDLPLTFKNIPIPNSELHHIGNLAKKCCNHYPIDRPGLQEIIEQLCDPVFQLVMHVTMFHGNISCACTKSCHVQDIKTSTTTSSNDEYTEAWICSLCIDGSEIVALSLKGIKLASEMKYFIRDHQIYTMLSHGNHVWATSLQAGCKGALLKFDGNKKDEYVEIPISRKVGESGNSIPDGDYGVSLTCSNDHVYVGTASGWCLMFPTDITSDAVPIRKVNLSCNYICSLIVVKKTSLLWASTKDQIFFVNLTDLEFDQDKRGVNTDDWQLKKLLLSPDEEVVWTVQTNGHSISAWKAQKRELICLFNSHNLLDQKIIQQRSRIASANVVLDTLWVGLISGHILVISATLPQRALIIMKPYDHMVQILVPIFKRDNNITAMISIGKDYQFEEQSNVKSEGDVVLWEAVNTERMLQISCLSTDNAWQNDASLKEVINSINSISDVQQQLQLVNNNEICPLHDPKIVSQYFDSEGGQLLIGKHTVAITVPKGAVEEGYKVQIEAAVSLIGPYDIPEGFYPVSAYVWVGTSYVFKKQVQVQIEHHAVLSQPNDLLQLSILTACRKDKFVEDNGQCIYKMEEAIYQHQCTIKESFCIFSTDHFCSNCLAKKDEKIPDRISVFHMLPKSYELVDHFSSEICFCYSLELCKQAVENRFNTRGWITNSSYSIDSNTSSDEEILSLSLPNNQGWIVTYKHSDKINISELDFRKYQNVADLKADEERDLFPPRFIIDLICLDRYHMLFAQCMVSCVSKNEKLVFNIYVAAKKSPQTETQKKKDVFIDYFSKIEAILETNALLGHFVSARIISIDDLDHIQNLVGREKARFVLTKISSGLNAGLSGSFEDLLSIMEKHGNQDSKRLADSIRKQLYL